MYRYRIFCLEIESELEFPQLMVSDSKKPADVSVAHKEIHRPQGVSELVKYEIGTSFSWLENKTCFLEVHEGKKIFYCLKDGKSVMDLRTYILGWGFSLLAFQRGELAIHCSAVENEAGAVLICGESGCGKSTITTAFLNQGYHLMADDMAFVETIDNISYVKPAFPFQKLCRDAAMLSGCSMEEMIYIDEQKDKFLVPYKGNFDGQKKRILAMIVLYKHAGDQVQATRVTGIGKMHACLGNLFLRNLLQEKKYAPEMGALGLAMAGSTEIYSIGRPRQKDTVLQVVEQAMRFVTSQSEEKI